MRLARPADRIRARALRARMVRGAYLSASGSPADRVETTLAGRRGEFGG